MMLVGRPLFLARGDVSPDHAAGGPEASRGPHARVAVTVRCGTGSMSVYSCGAALVYGRHVFATAVLIVIQPAAFRFFGRTVLPGLLRPNLSR
jgi:hypothetical protein